MLPDAEPYSHAGGPDGVLVIHGFTGSPQSMKPLARALAEAGYTVELPLLPGHGTTPADMARTGWPDWAQAAEDAYTELAGRCDRVVVAGLSMGGTLAVWLAAHHKEIAAVVVINPLIDPIGSTFVQAVEAARQSSEAYLPAIGSDIAAPGITESAYKAVPVASLLSLAEALPGIATNCTKITAPVLLFTSPHDHVVDPVSSVLLAFAVKSSVTRVPLERSFHVATLDYDGPLINHETVDFLDKILGRTGDAT